MLVKVHDGFVLAADSATTLSRTTPQGTTEVDNIYNNANKIFNLRKGLPIAAMTWGLGSIGPASIATLAKDVRRRFSGDDDGHLDWRLDPNGYTVAGVKDRMVEFFHAERYERLAKELVLAGSPVTELGLLVAGYSAGADQPEVWELNLSQGGVSATEHLAAGEAGALWRGQPEAITRLMLGTSQGLPQALLNLGVAAKDVSAYAQAIVGQVQIPLVSPAMPIQDAVDLAEFLVDTTIKFVRFSPGHPTVGGPVEVAAITKHENFKWVSRKHYFASRLNPSLENV